MFEEYVPNFQFLQLPEAVRTVIRSYNADITARDYIPLLNRSKKLALFGAGILGVNAVQAFKAEQQQVNYFIDNDPQKAGSFIEGIPVISFEEYLKRSDAVDVLITSTEFPSILKQFHSSHVIENVKGLLLFVPENPRVGLSCLSDVQGAVNDNIGHIRRLFSMLADNRSKEVLYAVLNYHITKNLEYFFPVKEDRRTEYFDTEILKFTDDECFIDAGVFDGYDTLRFIAQVNNKYRKIIMFEPDAACLPMIEKNVLKRNDPRIVLEKYALYDQDTTLCFGGQSSSFSINEHSSVRIKTARLDNYADAVPTYIKMDIEGSELAALRGAGKIIGGMGGGTKIIPKMAVSVYHKPFDLWEIPFFLKEKVPDYRIYFRHYYNFVFDTVMYAVLSDK